MRESDQQRLVEHYLDFYRMAYSLLHDPKDAEDVVQEALTRTLVRPLVRDPLNYCCRVLYNECFRMMKQRRRITLQETPADLVAESPEEAETRETHERRLSQLHEERSLLPDKYQEILTLHIDQNLTMNEIARQKGIPMTTVRKMISTAYRQLRRQMIPSMTEK